MKWISKKIENYLYIGIILASLAVIIHIGYKKITVTYLPTIFTHSTPARTSIQDIYFGNLTEPVTANYDSLKTGYIYQFEFILHNSGYTPVIIADITTNCSCTGYDLSKKILDQKDTARLKLFFNAKEKVGPQTVGVWFHLKEESTPRKLYLTGRIYP